MTAVRIRVVVWRKKTENRSLEVLWIRRPATVRKFPLKVNLPGGKPDPTDKAEHALLMPRDVAIRELREEAGISIDPKLLTYVGSVGISHPHYPRGCLTVYFHVEVADNSCLQVNQEDAHEWGWATPAEVCNLDPVPGTMEMLDLFVERIDTS
jgi:8-oxo-dGTP pyrophosphatase MutT (NUDIX family)